MENKEEELITRVLILVNNNEVIPDDIVEQLKELGIYYLFTE